MVKRMQHIGTFLHNEMGVSLRGISSMCGRSSIHLQKIFFLKSIEAYLEEREQRAKEVRQRIERHQGDLANLRSRILARQRSG